MAGTNQITDYRVTFVVLCAGVAAFSLLQSMVNPVLPTIEGALDTVRATAAEGTLQTGGLGLDDVGDMVEVKAALTEAVLWPLQYPDTFARLGVEAPRGILLYGPPGCGKTFLVRALAGSGQANVFSVKGAELLSKWVGESEAAVQRALSNALEGRTSLVIAHRLSTVHEADQILVVEDGRVVERGRHDELLERGGLYTDLYRRQFAAQEDEPVPVD